MPEGSQLVRKQARLGQACRQVLESHRPCPQSCAGQPELSAKPRGRPLVALEPTLGSHAAL